MFLYKFVKHFFSTLKLLILGNLGCSASIALMAVSRSFGEDVVK